MVKKITSILILCPYPERQAPSQRFRFEQYLDILVDRSYRFTLAPFFDEKTWKILYGSGKMTLKAWGFIQGIFSRLRLALFGLHQYDIVFIHREAMPLGPPIIEWLIAKVFKKKIIYDFDDAIWLANTSAENKIVAWLKWHSKVKTICSWSYRISCGNDYLAAFAKNYNANVFVNPTTIDTRLRPSHPIIKNNQVVVVGWTGTHSTLKYLDSLFPVFESLKKKINNSIEFLIIADKPPKMNLPFTYIKWSRENEIDDLLKIDIGIMPLEDDLWAKGKCGFKALQYMALEIPAIVSPVGVNTSIITNGLNGLLCSTPDEWLASISYLIENPEIRKNLGKAGKETVDLNYSVYSNRENFLSLFDN